MVQAQHPTFVRRLGALAFLLAFILLVALPSDARPDLTVSQEARSEIPLSSFGFYERGVLNFTINDFKISDANVSGDLGILLFRAGTYQPRLDHTECPTGSPIFVSSKKENKTKFYPLKIDEDGNVIKRLIGSEVVKKRDEGIWTLVFANCKAGTYVSFTAVIDELNGSSRLSAGDFPLPSLYASFAVMYIVMAAIWLFVLLKKDAKVVWPHWLMFALVFIKSISAGLHSMKYWYLSQGSELIAENYAISDYIFTFFKSALSIAIIVLIGSGWYFIKPFLNDRDKKILGIVVPLQIFTSVAQVVAEETAFGSEAGLFFTKIFPVVDFVACVVVVIPIFKTKDYLSQGSTADGKASENATRYRTWGQFYVLTLAYVYLTRIAAQLLVSALDFRVTWVRDLCVELTTAAFYAAVGWMFRPVSGSDYFRLPDSDEAIELEEARTRENMENAVTAAAAGTTPAGALRRRNHDGPEEAEHLVGAEGGESGDWELGWENDEDEDDQPPPK